MLFTRRVVYTGRLPLRRHVVEGNTNECEFQNVDKVLEEPGVQIRFFGKPEIKGHRRVGVILATDETVEKALQKAERAYSKLRVKIY